MGALQHFWWVYVNDILLIRNDVKFLESIKGCLKGVFQRKTWIKLLTYWASRSIEIDQDAWWYFQKTAHLDMILKEFKIDQQRRSSWLCYKVWVLSETQDLTTAEDRERTKVVPYALDIGSIVCYAVYRTCSVPCHKLVKRVQWWSGKGSHDSGWTYP